MHTPLYQRMPRQVKWQGMHAARNILFTGDSLIEFFDWAERFPSHRVRNLGKSGETVEELLLRAPDIIKKHPSADLIFIMSGINNLAMEETNFLPAYRDIIRVFASAWPGARIFVHSLFPTLLPWIEDSAIREMNISLRRLAGQCGANFLDIYPLFLEKGLRDCLLPDGIHISDTGYAVWSEAVEKVIGQDRG